MSQPTPLQKAVRVDPSAPEHATVPGRRFDASRWSIVAVVALALLLWAPRLSGPIDLRWDAGVYYLLGTSLAKGEGYRIASEPGSPEALQYPPLLPALVALHQWALGTTDPAIVAPWLRRSYAALFVAYSMVVLALAKRHLSPGFALAATTLCMLHIMTIFLSDLLFAELPFAVVSVVFALVAAGGLPSSRPWVRETASFALAAAGFLLRTAGVILLGAWVIEALARRRLRLALLRGLLALLPIALWQAFVVHVRASDAYVSPAYEYQRAPYQNYNVTYTENILLVDPFRPDLGRLDPGGLAARLVTNLARMPAALGEAVSAPKPYWQSALERANRLLGQPLLPVGVVWVPILGFGALVVAGSRLFIRCHEWVLASILLLSIALVCLTPWPEEFGRYLTPTAPFLTIAAILALERLDTALRARGSCRPTLLARLALASLLVLLLAVQTFTALQLFVDRDREGASFVPGRGPTGPRFFYHGRSWLAWEQAVAWIGARAAPSAIVATSVPHQFYLRTGLRAVYPPMDADPEQAHRLLEAVPVSYVIVDEMRHRDFSRRYALPAVESHPASWRLVHGIDGTRIYEHTAGTQ